MKIKELYDQDINIQQYFREEKGVARNEINSILYSYDYQAGSYTKEYFNPEVIDGRYVVDGENVKLMKKEYYELKGQWVAEELKRLNPHSLLEVGVGEANSLCDIMRHLPEEVQVSGLELSLSRLLYAQKFAAYKKANIQFVMGDMFHLPYQDSTFDVILLSHCLESNTGREREALKELLRVAGKYLVLLEPSYELGNEETKKRIKKLCYIDNLQQTIEEMGLTVIKNELFRLMKHDNNTAITIIKKEQDNDKEPFDVCRTSAYACPSCRTELHQHNEAFFCPECFNLYPVIHGIPILNMNHGILCSKYEADDFQVEEEE